MDNKAIQKAFSEGVKQALSFFKGDKLDRKSLAKSAEKLQKNLEKQQKKSG